MLCYSAVLWQTRKWKNSPICPSKVGNMGLITLLPILETDELNFPVFIYDCTTQVISGNLKNATVPSPLLGLHQPCGPSVQGNMFAVSFLMRFLDNWNKDFVYHQFELAEMGRGNDTTPAYAKHIIFP